MFYDIEFTEAVTYNERIEAKSKDDAIKIFIENLNNDMYIGQGETMDFVVEEAGHEWEA